MKFLKSSDKEKILKVARETKAQISCQKLCKQEDNLITC